MAEVVELHTVLEVLRTAEEAGHMAGVEERVHCNVVVGIEVVEVRRKVAVGVVDTPVAVGMDYEVAAHRVAAAVEGIPGYTVLVEALVEALVEGIVRTLEVRGSRHNPAAEGILEAGIGLVEAVGILLRIMSRKQSIRQAWLTRWRSAIVRWITTLMRRV